MQIIEPPVDPSVLIGRHTALVANLAWSRREDESSSFNVPTLDLNFETIIEPYDGASVHHIEAAMRHGIFEGVKAFNHNRFHSSSEAPSERLPPTRLPYGCLSAMAFNALRNDMRRASPMNDLELTRSAIQVLSALSSALESVSHIVWLGWGHGSGNTAFYEFYSRIRSLGQEETLHGASLPFPRQDLPDLAARMEKLDLQAAVSARTLFSPSKILRI